MSFSGKVKEELVEIIKPARHCQIAEIAGVVSMCGDVLIDEQDRYKLRIHTENQAVVSVYETLLEKAFHIQPRVSTYRHRGNRSDAYIAVVDEPGKALEILQAIKMIDVQGEIREEMSARKNLVTQRNCCKRAYIRGAFLAAGSISDPRKSYHFEIVCNSRRKAEFLQAVMASFEMEAKVVLRKKTYVVYLKEGAQIVDMLNIMEAHVALMELENIRILKGMRENVNRKVNCETANINKTVSAAVRQIEDINYIKEIKGLDYLSETLYDMACTRLEYPDASLLELGELSDPPVGKSGVNHRLRKISDIAERLRQE